MSAQRVLLWIYDCKMLELSIHCCKMLELSIYNSNIIMKYFADSVKK